MVSRAPDRPAPPEPGRPRVSDPLMAVDPELREAARLIMAEVSPPLTRETIVSVRGL